MDFTIRIAAAQYCISVVSVAMIYLTLGPQLYSQPRRLLVLGLTISLIALILRALPMVAESVWQSEGGEGFDIAASAVDVTLFAVAGTLIGAAFLLKIQHQHAHDVASLEEMLRRLEQRIEDLQREIAEYENDDKGIVEIDRKLIRSLLLEKRHIEQELAALRPERGI